MNWWLYLPILFLVTFFGSWFGGKMAQRRERKLMRDRDDILRMFRNPERVDDVQQMRSRRPR